MGVNIESECFRLSQLINEKGVMFYIAILFLFVMTGGIVLFVSSYLSQLYIYEEIEKEYLMMVLQLIQEVEAEN
jgi:hypothetical protein